MSITAKTIRKPDLLDQLSDLGYARYQMAPLLNDIFYIIGEDLVRGYEVQIRGFGNFSVKTTKPHKSYNYITQQVEELEEYKNVRFKPSGSLTAAVRECDSEKLKCLKNES